MDEKYESILLSIKKLLGIADDDKHFDTDIIMDINSAISVLTQVGVGPQKGFRIKDEKSTWAELLGDREDLDDVKSFIHIRVKLLFDTSTMSSAVIEIMKQQADEYLWRINVAAEEKDEEEIQHE